MLVYIKGETKLKSKSICWRSVYFNSLLSNTLSVQVYLHGGSVHLIPGDETLEVDEAIQTIWDTPDETRASTGIQQAISARIEGYLLLFCFLVHLSPLLGTGGNRSAPNLSVYFSLLHNVKLYFWIIQSLNLVICNINAGSSDFGSCGWLYNYWIIWFWILWSAI